MPISVPVPVPVPEKVAKRLGLVEATCYDEARRLLLRDVSMPVRMAQGTGTGTGTGTKGP